MNKIITTLVTAFAISAPTTMAQDSSKKKTVQITQAQADAYKKAFQQYLTEGSQFKDAKAVELMAQAKANQGKINVSLTQMIQLVNKWRKDGAPTRFKKLLAQKTKAKDSQALEFQAQIKAKGKLEMTPAKMLEVIKKWEAKPVSKDPLEVTN